MAITTTTTVRASLKECVLSRRCSVSSRTRKKYTKQCDVIAVLKLYP